MNTQRTASHPGFTFPVDKVKPATKPLAEWRTHDAVKHLLGGEVESCCDYHGKVVKGNQCQALLDAVYTAFNHHYPLVLTPDAVWITIAQGVAHHTAIHGERLRSKFVRHQGRVELAFEFRDWVEGSPENPWPEAWDSWAEQIRDHVGSALHDLLVCDFSTTGSNERAVSQIVMMDVFERYFQYLAYGICGIPTVTLEGTPTDWQHLADKAAALKVFDLDWWLAHLLPICEQFVRASRGDVDVKHWRGICKLRQAYGGHIINGWVAKLFPYLRAYIEGPCNRRNPIFETGEGFQTLIAPSGLSRVPFTWRNAKTGRERRMEAIGGLVGSTQHPETLALRPKLGWAVREAGRMEALLARLASEHVTFPGLCLGQLNELPPDLTEFYLRTGGSELFGTGTAAACRIVAAPDIEPLDWGVSPKKRERNTKSDGIIWHRFAWLADGSWLAINLAPGQPNPCFDPENEEDDQLCRAICHSQMTNCGSWGRNPVIALSFVELLERLLSCDGQLFWLDPLFVSYGDAAEFTRRD